MRSDISGIFQLIKKLLTGYAVRRGEKLAKEAKMSLLS